MSLVLSFKNSVLIAATATLLTSSALASDQSALKIADEALMSLQSKKFEQSIELYDDALAESELSDVVKGQVLSAKANALLELGWASRQEKPLNDSIATYEMALELLSKENAPLDWARANAKLGDVYRSLGYGMYNKNDQKTGAQFYEKSISSFHNALTILNKQENFEEWAVAQRALGQALTNSDTLLAVSGKPTNASSLSKAIAAFNAAAEFYTKEAAPSDWAGLQFQLGDVYTTLHQRKDGIWLPQAVDAHRRVLEVLTEEINPSVWAQVHYFIGNNLAELGAIEKDKDLLVESIKASQVALESNYFKQISPEFYDRNLNNIKVAESLIKKYEAQN